jgi:hypothetical protein
MPTLQSHTHCQAAQRSRTSQSLSKSVSFPTLERQKRKHDCTTMVTVAQPYKFLKNDLI